MGVRNFFNKKEGKIKQASRIIPQEYFREVILFNSIINIFISESLLEITYILRYKFFF